MNLVCRINTHLSGALLLPVFCLLFCTSEAQVGSPYDVVPLPEVTHTAIASGLWSDAENWDNGLPAEGSRVMIPEGVEITISSVMSTRIRTIRLEGQLLFAPDANTELLVESIIGTSSSELKIGDATNPVQPEFNARILFIDEGPLDLDNDEGQFGKGLVTEGKVEMYGAEKVSWMSLESPALTGQDALSLSQAPAGWNTGDVIVIAATELGNPESDEKRTITSVNGLTIGLDAPLEMDHTAPQGYELNVHVANLSRNVILESENEAIDRRAHVMFMNSLDVNMHHVRMHKLGRTDKRVQVDDWFFPTLVADDYFFGDRTNIRGRYSCHFHRGGVNPNTTSPAVVRACVIEDDPGWAYVNHSSNVDFIDNVSYNVVGGAYQTESGDEIGSFIDNIALRTINPDYPLLDPATAPVDIREDSQDFAFQGDGFWFHGGGVVISGNVSSGHSGHGFIFWTEGQREVSTIFDLQNMFAVSNIPNGELLGDLDYIQSWWVPVLAFDNNTAYCGVNGFAAYYVHATLFEDITTLTDAYLETVHTTFNDLSIWNMSRFGVELQNCERFTFNHLRVVNTEVIPESEGVRCWQTVSNESLWNELMINGFETGMTPPMQGQIHLCGGAFTNQTDLQLIPPQRDSRAQGDLRDIRIEHVVFGQRISDYDFINEANIKLCGEEALSGSISFLDPEYAAKFFLIPDRITMNLDGLSEQTLYYNEQAADYVPISTQNAGIASGAYANLVVDNSNQEIFNQTGLAFAGGIQPSGCSPSPLVQGGVVSSTDISRSIPSCHFIDEGYFEANYFDDFEFLDCWEQSSPIDHSPMTNHSFALCNASNSIAGIQSKSDQLTLYPNPASETVVISSTESIYRLDIYSSNGVCYRSLPVHAPSVEVVISDLPRGLYLVRAYTHTGIQSKSFIRK